MNVARNFYKGVDWTIWFIGWLLCLPLRIVYSLLRNITPKLVSSFQPPKKKPKPVGPSPFQQKERQSLELAVKDTNVAAKRFVKEKTRVAALESQCKALGEENAIKTQRIEQLEKSLRKDVKDKDVPIKDIQNEKDEITEEVKSLRKKESESKRQIEGLKKERDDKENELRQSENQIIKLKESLSKKDSESKKQIEALRRERDDKQNQLRQSEGQITESLPRKDSESRKEIETLTKERDDKQNQLSQSVDQIAKLKESLNKKESDFRKQTEALRKESDDIRNQLKESKDQITKLKESLCQQVKTKDDSIKSLQEDRDHVADVLKAAQEEVTGFKNQIASLQEELEKHDAVMQENRQLMVALNEKEMVLRVAEDAKEDALRRLSQSVSLRLRDNNPNIVDLSDKYRPSKLAEMMSELYDNQWTDAFTYLEDNWGHGNTFSETECIEFLLNVLMEINTFCLSKITNDWTDGLEKILLTAKPNDEAEVVKMLKDIRKKNALTQIPNVEKMCVIVLQNTELAEDSSFSKHLLQDKLYEYLKECVKLCLLMAVQDPPVCLVCDGWKTRQTNKGENSCPPADSTSDIIQNGTVEKRKEFDRGSYKEYTKRGQFIEYIVWPLIYLHDNGPILSKGVAQGCDTSTIPPHDDL